VRNGRSQLEVSGCQAEWFTSRFPRTTLGGLEPWQPRRLSKPSLVVHADTCLLTLRRPDSGLTSRCPGPRPAHTRPSRAILVRKQAAGPCLPTRRSSRWRRRSLKSNQARPPEHHPHLGRRRAWTPRSRAVREKRRARPVELLDQWTTRSRQPFGSTAVRTLTPWASTSIEAVAVRGSSSSS
jgi:hypothetical protein